jgi:predicted dehydrogenase
MAIKIGLIGCGIVTQKAHIPAIVRDQRFQITALCRRNSGKLNLLAQQFPSAKLFTDSDNLIKSGEVDCILIAADVDAHLSIAQNALDKGLYVLVEKPVASSSEDIKKFIEKNSKNLDKIMVAFNKRFYPGIVKLDELISSGEISNIIGGTLSFITKQSRKPGKKGILQNLIHLCELSCHIFGKPVNISANFSSKLNDDTDGKTIAASILTEKGAAVNLFFTSSSSWKVPVHERIEILDDKKNSYYVEDIDRITFSKSDEGGGIKNFFSRESNSIFFRYNSFGYEAQITRFGDLVENKINKPSPNMHDALAAQELFEKIFEFDKGN